MGAWSYKIFESDDALDFMGDVERDNSEVIKAIEEITILKDTDYLESYDATKALVAIEILAAKKGKPSESFLGTGVDINKIIVEPAQEIIEKSIFVISRIDKNSELRELMNERGGENEFTKILSDLKDRISKN
jgi:hypothetical protein